MHSRQSGVTDHYAQNDAHAIGIARRIVGKFAELSRKEDRVDARSHGRIIAQANKPSNPQVLSIIS